MCAAAAVELLVMQGLEQAVARWDDVAAVLIDATGTMTGLDGWRGPLIVVGLAADAVLTWQQAEQLGADRVAILPDSAPWLANYLSCLRSPVSGAGVVGIVGGCGGIGSSTLAAALAVSAAKRGVRTLLVDGDPWGGGMGLLLAADEASGLHWPELLRASGAINPEQLAASLPYFAGLAMLSWNTDTPGSNVPFGSAQLGEQGPTAVGEVMRAARGAYGLVVVDVGRTPDAFASLARHCDGMGVLVTGRARAVAAAASIVASLPLKPAVAIVRGPLHEGVDATMIAAAVDLPLVGTMPRLRVAAEARGFQQLSELVRRRPMRRLTTSLLQWMAGEGTVGAHGQPSGSMVGGGR
ncbi:septum site-determining protein Ssd [Arthrobacter psychrolactophilus]